jgi:hypothetical protein
VGGGVSVITNNRRNNIKQNPNTALRRHISRKKNMYIYTHGLVRQTVQEQERHQKPMTARVRHDHGKE